MDEYHKDSMALSSLSAIRALGLIFAVSFSLIVVSLILQGNFSEILSSPADWINQLDRGLAFDIVSTSAELLAAVLAKLFADRQITPKPDVIPYLLGHMERSFEAAAEIVGKLDRLSLDEKRTITRRLAARVISGDNR